MEEQLQTFFPSSANVALINKKEQGKVVCQNQISQEWIDHTIETKSFGISFVNGFILCRIPERQQVAWIELVCSRAGNKTGKVLMEMAEAKLKELGIRMALLNCINDVKLKKWYEKQGYAGSEMNIWDGKTKGYSMHKFLDA